MGNATALQVVNNQTAQIAAQLEFSPQELDVIKRTVAKGATNDEFAMFIHLCRAYGLDPFNKEIWFIKYVKQGQDPKKVDPTIMTSRDGYLKIADRSPMYDGLVSDVVCQNDKFKRTIEGVEHEYSSNRGAITGAYALVYRKDRKYPIYVFAPIAEYRGISPIWSKYPSAMILKVAESMALKRAFSVSGLVSKEEMDYEASDESLAPTTVIEPTVQVRDTVVTETTSETLVDVEAPSELMSTDVTLSRIRSLFETGDQEVVKLRKETANLYIKDCNVLRLSELTERQAQELVLLLENL